MSLFSYSAKSSVTNPHKFDRRIYFQEQSGSADTFNQRTKSWSDITDADMWAAVIESKGYEAIRADQVDVIRPTVFIIRYRSDINEQMRVVYNQHPYNIESIILEGRKKFMHVFARIDLEETIT